MNRKGQVDAVVVSVTFLALVLVGLIMLGSTGSGGITGFFTAGAPAATPAPQPTPLVILVTPVPTPYVAPTPTPYDYSGIYNPPIVDGSCGSNNYNCQYGGNCNGYPCYANPTPYPYYPTYPTPYAGYSSLIVTSNVAPINVYVDDSYKATINSYGSSYTIYGLTSGYHKIYAFGNGCSDTQQVNVNGNYQQSITVCGNSYPYPTAYPGYLPDLSAESYVIGTYVTEQYSTSHFDAGTAYYTACNNGYCRYPAYRLRVRNVGGYLSPDFDLSINPSGSYSNGAYYYYINSTPLFGALGPNGYRDIFVYAVPSGRQYSITASPMVNPSQTFNEQSYSNNQLSFSIPVNYGGTGYGSVMISTDADRTGTYGLRLDDRSNTGSYGAFQVVPIYNTVQGMSVSGMTFTLQGYSREASGYGNLMFRLEYLDSDRNVISTQTTSATSQSWSSFTLSNTVPSNAYYAVVSVYSASSSQALFYADDLSLSQSYGYGNQFLYDPGFEDSTSAASSTYFDYHNAPTSRWVLVNPY